MTYIPIYVCIDRPICSLVHVMDMCITILLFFFTFKAGIAYNTLRHII